MTKQLKEISTAQLLKLKSFLDEQVKRIEQPEYIQDDPVCFMHAFNEKEDQVLAGFFAALFAWGRRDVVINKTQELLERMGYNPAAFIGNFKEADSKRLEEFKHRTFKPVDIYWLVKTLQKILLEFSTFEAFWNESYQEAANKNEELITIFHHKFFNLFPQIPQRTRKHISNPRKKSPCKRLYLYLRWVIRKNSPVDCGLMNFMPASELIIPLDVHSARQARILGMLPRRYNDWKAAQQLTEKLRTLDPQDPAKYDFALFGLGVNEQEIPDEFILNPQFIE